MTSRVENGAELARLVPPGSGGVALVPADTSEESARALEARGVRVERSPWAARAEWSAEER